MTAAAPTPVPEPVRRTVLLDGRRVVIRPLAPADGAALIAAVASEDPWDLRRRFMGVPPEPRKLARSLRRADGYHDLVIGAFSDDGRLVGVAQFDRRDDGPVAEVAVEVAHDWQRDRLGTALLLRLAELARDRGIHEFTATYYADNVAIRRLLRDIGHVVASGIDHGDGFATLTLDDE